MPTLRETEAAFLHAMIDGGSDAVAQAITGGAFTPDERLAIYRNTFLSSLTAALRISFPAVHRLVGEEFFDGAARVFIAAYPPRSAYLNAYGAEFAAFLDGFAPASSLPYLGDVARLEWAVNVALHAADATPLDARALNGIAPEQLVLRPHPSLGFLHLSHPAQAIWRAVLDDNDAALAAIDLSAGEEWLMIARGRDGVTVAALNEAECRFGHALFSGISFAAAFDAAPATAPQLFAHHLAAGHCIGFQAPENISPIS